MEQLDKNEIKDVRGGHPAIVYGVNIIAGGLIYDGLKEAYNQLKTTERKTSSGGNMHRGRRESTSIADTTPTLTFN